MPIPNTVNDTVGYTPRNIYACEDVLVDIDDGNRLDIYGDVYLNGSPFSAPMGTDVRNKGAKGDNVTNDHLALVSAFTNPTAPVLFPSLTFLDSSGRIDITNPITIVSLPGGTIRKTHGGAAVQIMPVAEPGGVVTVGAAGDTTVSVTGATWATNQHVGKWAALGAAFPESRKVVSNTINTLTLDYPLGGVVAAGSTLTFYTPLAYVNIDGLTIDGSNIGSANVIIQYASSVRLRNLTSLRSGGNALSVYWSEDVVVEDYKCDGGNFGAFFYGCRSGKVVRPLVRNWRDEYGVQLKDCMGMDIIDADVNPLAAGGDVGLNIKCSGLNPTKDLRIINGMAVGCGSFGLHMEALSNEGTFYGAENFAIVGGQTRACVADWGVVSTGTGFFRDAYLSGMQGLDATSASFTLSCSDVEMRDFYSEGSWSRAGTVTGSRNVLKGTIKNACMSGTADAAIQLNNADMTDVNVKVIHTIAGSNMNRAVRELNGCINNNIRRQIRDIGGTAFSADILLEAANGTRAWREPGTDEMQAATIISAAADTWLVASTATAVAPVTSDEKTLITCSNAGTITVTLPSNATMPFPVSGEIEYVQIGVGQVVFVAGSGATVNSALGLKARAQWSRVVARKIGTNGWLLYGDTAV